MTPPRDAQVEVDRVNLGWTVDAPLPPASRARLDRLALGLGGRQLEDALSGPHTDGGEVCLRRVDTPPLTFDWSATDDQLLTAWAQAVGDAAATLLLRGDAVRYPTRSHARLDMVVSLLAGDRERAWAWALLGLDAATSTAATDAAGAVRSALAETSRTTPELVGPLAAEVARRGLLATCLRWVGPEALHAAGEAAWTAAGGAPLAFGDDLPVDPGTPGAVASLAASVARRSVIFRAAAHLEPDPQLDGRTVPSTPPPERRLAMSALARLALVEAEPGLVRAPRAGGVVSRLYADLVPGAEQAPDHSAGPPDAGLPDGQVEPAGPSPAPSSSAGPPAPASAGSPAVPGASAVAPGDDDPALTSPVPLSPWGGLLFLLPVLDRDGFPDRVVDDPTTYGVSLRRALWLLAVEVVARAAPDAPPAHRDPAVLAWCGLPADADPPGGEGSLAWVRPEADRLVRAVRLALTDDDSRATLLQVLRRPVRLRVEPGWIDAEYDLDDVDVEVRAAGLDIDPGFVPWIGAVVRFRYV